MNAKFSQLIFYVVLLILVSVLFYFVAQPYVSAIFLAIITSILFRPVYLRIAHSLHGRHNLASLITVIIALTVIILPILLVGNLLIKESASFYVNNQDLAVGGAAIDGAASNIEDYIQDRVPGFNLNVDNLLEVGPYTEKGFAWLTSHLSSFFTGLLRVTLGAFLYVLCLFYLFRDHDKIIKNVLNWSPLFDTYDNLILSKITTTVNSVLRGQLLVGLIQGLLTGLGFWIFGVPNPVIWGTVAAIASLVPAIGTSLINIPAVIFLVFNGHLPQAIGLAAWAAVAVGLVDNILGPYFINRGVKIHSFLILISVLGGISFFGPIGFIAGPVVLGLLSALLELYPVIIKNRVDTQ